MGDVRIGIDTGGTFTDVVRWARGGLVVHKLPSTPADPGQAVLAGLAHVRRNADETVDVVHGTTVGLNAVLTGRVARTVFVTNRGFEDLIEIGRQDRTALYALAPDRPTPPVERRLRVGVACRREPDGSRHTALTPDEIERCVNRVVRLRPAAIAIGLLHSPTDPADEHRLARALRRALPDVPVSCSADVLPAFGEYERFTATILNAAIAPIVSTYTARLTAAVGAGRLRLLRSSLGIMPVAEATEFPARAMFSGPAGGVLATAQLAQAAGYPHAAAFDMGGTSADVGLVQANGLDGTLGEGTIAGLPLHVPSVAIHTVGCGGGSIAYADAGGALRVGPMSAGAVPGPACYGQSDEPTVTDAHVALGHLGAETLLAGDFPIDVDASVRAIERLASRLGMRTADAARGILEVADIAMARAILVITAERAIDPATVPLVPYGGAGALHAAGLVRRLGMPCALVPANPGAFSATGLALAGESAERSRAVRLEVRSESDPRLAEIAAAIAAEVRAALPTARRIQRFVTMRYRGQGAGLVLPLRRGLGTGFAQEHERRFGFVADSPLEIVRVGARAESPPKRYPIGSATASGAGRHRAPARSRQQPEPDHRRQPPIGGRALPVYRREHLKSGDRIRGPAVVEESTATTAVPPGFLACITDLGLLLAVTNAASE